jgi:hypothetical protein
MPEDLLSACQQTGDIEGFLGSQLSPVWVADLRRDGDVFPNIWDDRHICHKIVTSNVTDSAACLFGDFEDGSAGFSDRIKVLGRVESARVARRRRGCLCEVRGNGNNCH